MNCALCGSQATKIGPKGQMLCEDHFEQFEKGEKVKTFSVQRVDDLPLTDKEAEEIGFKLEHMRKTVEVTFGALNLVDEEHPAPRINKVTFEVVIGPTIWLLTMSTVLKKVEGIQEHGNSNADETTANA